MSDMTIELPNSPGVEVTITRGGTDAVTGEVYSDQYVRFSWVDENGDEKGGGFLGPAT